MNDVRQIPPRTRRVMVSQPVADDATPSSRLQEGDFVCLPMERGAANDSKVVSLSQYDVERVNLPGVLVALTLLVEAVAVVAGLCYLAYRVFA